MNLILAYASAHFGKTLIWSFFNTFFLFFAVYAMGIAPFTASIFAFAFALADAAFDLPAAYTINRYLKRLSGMSIWVTVFTPVCAVALFLCFYLPVQTGIAHAAAWGVLSGLICRLAFTFIDVPMNASVGRFDYQSKRRNYVVLGRSVASTSARILLATLTYFLVERGGEIEAGKLWTIAAIISVLAPMAIIPCFRKLDKRAFELEQQHPGLKQGNDGFPWRALLTRNLLLLFAANLVFLSLGGQFGGALIFMIENDPQISAPFSLIWLVLSIISAVSVWPWMRAASSAQKSQVALLALFATTLVVMTFPSLKSTVLGITAFILLYASVFHVNSMIWSMLPDAVDESSKCAGRPIHALAIGTFAAFGKLMIGASQLVTGALLQATGFPDTPNFDAYQYTAIIVTVAGCLVTGIILSRYDLSHARHAELTKELVQR